MRNENVHAKSVFREWYCRTCKRVYLEWCERRVTDESRAVAKVFTSQMCYFAKIFFSRQRHTTRYQVTFNHPKSRILEPTSCIKCIRRQLVPRLFIGEAEKIRSSRIITATHSENIHSHLLAGEVHIYFGHTFYRAY